MEYIVSRLTDAATGFCIDKLTTLFEQFKSLTLTLYKCVGIGEISPCNSSLANHSSKYQGQSRQDYQLELIIIYYWASESISIPIGNQLFATKSSNHRK